MISDKDIKKVFSRIMPDYTIESIKNYSKGQVNEIFFVSLINEAKNIEEELVLRIYPSDGWKAEKEKYLFNLVMKKTSVLVPGVIITDTSKKIINYNYAILKRVLGEELGESKNKKLVKEAGKILAEIHTIKFDSFGWIVGKKIEPKFKKWVDFLEFDLKHKIKKAKSKLPKKLVVDILDYFERNKELLDIVTVPSLLHKDYSYAHIIVDKEINGIIDWEWAIAGHHEFDLVKSLLWMFEKDKKREKIFLSGYKKQGKLSKDFEKRRKIYELLIFFNSFVFSTECKSKLWCRYNLAEIKELLYGKHS
jgi:aminoglycoside phosphotransferase (APT) family kinase protein